jgi:hypothetical protein
MLISEFLSNADVAEAERSLHELAAKEYHHEFVRRCADAAFEHPDQLDQVVTLLRHMCNTGVYHSCVFAHTLDCLQDIVCAVRIDAQMFKASFIQVASSWVGSIAVDTFASGKLPPAVYLLPYVGKAQ